jgi:hypothetical protein
MPLHVPQVEEAQPEPPRLVDIGQPHQQIGDYLVLVVALRAVAETGLADPNARQASAMLTPFVATAFSANSRR